MLLFALLERMKKGQQGSWILATLLVVGYLSVAIRANDEPFLTNQLPDDSSGIVTIDTGDLNEEDPDQETFIDPLFSVINGKFYPKRSHLNKNFIRFGRSGMEERWNIKQLIYCNCQSYYILIITKPSLQQPG